MTQAEKTLQATSHTDWKATTKTEMMATRHMGLGTRHDFNSGKPFERESNKDEMADFFIDAAAALARKLFCHQIT